MTLGSPRHAITGQREQKAGADIRARVMSAIVHALALFLMLVMVLAGARAQNLDQDKSGAKLFASSCAECHRSARGLAKGRLSFTLSYYLRQHYTSSAASAQTLTAYLQSVDTPPAKAKPAARKSESGARKSQPTSAATRTPKSESTNEGTPRPPGLVPGR
jgi:mono/diheme cytochrome c family protein